MQEVCGSSYVTRGRDVLLEVSRYAAACPRHKRPFMLVNFFHPAINPEVVLQSHIVSALKLSNFGVEPGVDEGKGEQIKVDQLTVKLLN